MRAALIGLLLMAATPAAAGTPLPENGVARVLVEGEAVSVVALAQGRSSLVLVDTAGAKTTWQIQVR